MYTVSSLMLSVLVSATPLYHLDQDAVETMRTDSSAGLLAVSLHCQL